MRPTKLTLRNFKSIGQSAQSIELAPITLLFGPNSAGKSTVLQSLIYLREILLYKNLDPDKTEMGGEWLDLGGFKNMVHGRDLSRSIEISIEFDLEGDQLSDYLTENDFYQIDEAGYNTPLQWLSGVKKALVSIHLRWSEWLDRPIVELYSVSINEEVFIKIKSSTDGNQVYLEELNLNHSIMDISHPERGGTVGAEEGLRGMGDLFAEYIPTSFFKPNSYGVARPFLRKSIEELHDLVRSAEETNLEELKLVYIELSFRTTSEAKKLKKAIEPKVLSLMNAPFSSGDNGALSGLQGALPDFNKSFDCASLISASNKDIESDSKNVSILITGLISGLAYGPALILSHWLTDSVYVGPLREVPDRNFQPQKTRSISRWSTGIAAWEKLYQVSVNTLDELNRWFGADCLKTGYRVELRRYRELPSAHPLFRYLDTEIDLDAQIRLKDSLMKIPIKTRLTLIDERGNLEVMPQDIGVGISQLLPVVVGVITHEKGILAIEQPELHVHPRIQVELATLVSEYALKGGNKIVLLETHSEHFVLRLMRRIREGKISDKSVGVTYVQPAEEGCKFIGLRIDEEGDFIDEWPGGFFEESFKEKLAGR